MVPLKEEPVSQAKVPTNLKRMDFIGSIGPESSGPL